MGPPEFTGGNEQEAETTLIDLRRLQWGRRNSPAETRVQGFVQLLVVLRASMGPPEFTGGNMFGVGLPPGSGYSLQWGRRNSPAETLKPALL